MDNQNEPVVEQVLDEPEVEPEVEPDVEPDVIIFKYKIVLGGEKPIFISPSQDDFEPGLKEEMGDISLYSEENIGEIISKKYAKFLETQLGGIKTVGKLQKK